MTDALETSLEQLGMSNAGNLFAELKSAYQDPARHYHNETHVAECLRQFQGIRHLAMRPAEVEMAIWFHDAVYDPQRSDNEAQSAAWAERVLVTGGADSDAVGRVVEMILATKTHEATRTDAELLLDVDLGILGAPPDVFERYDQAIRLEYDWVPEGEYCRVRSQVLQSFLNRKYIYHSQAFRDLYENQARLNLTGKINELSIEHKSAKPG